MDKNSTEIDKQFLKAILLIVAPSAGPNENVTENIKEEIKSFVKGKEIFPSIDS